MKSNLMLVRLIGMIALLMGIWFFLHNLIHLSVKQGRNIYHLVFHFSGALLYLICGIGLIKLKKWGAYLFIFLMSYYLYKQIVPISVFITRIREGNIVAVFPEVFVTLLIILSVIFPLTVVIFLSRPGVRAILKKKRGH